MPGLLRRHFLHIHAFNALEEGIGRRRSAEDPRHQHRHHSELPFGMTYHAGPVLDPTQPLRVGGTARALFNTARTRRSRRSTAATIRFLPATTLCTKAD